MKYKSAILKGTVSAIFVFLLGFGMMFLLWKTIGNPYNLPGLFYYRAATIGDGICLPVLVASGIAFLEFNKGCLIKESKKIVAYILTIAALVIAVLIQASWLIRNDTALNWTIPVQHHFNIAGWYHSLFFVVMFGVIAYLFSCVWKMIRRKCGEYTYFEYMLLMVMFFSGSLFLLMHITDDYKEYSLGILFFVFVIIIHGLLSSFIWSAKHRASRKIWAAMVLGVESAYCVALLICIHVQGDILLAVGGGVCTCFLWRISNFTFPQMIVQNLWTISTHICIVYVLTGISSIREQIFICIPFVIMVVVNEYLHSGKMEWRFFSVGLMVIYPVFSNALPLIKDIDDAKNILFSFSVVLLFKKEIRIYFEELMEAENDVATNRINKEEFLDIKKKVYLQIVFGIFSVLLVLMHWLYDLARDRQYTISAGNINLSASNIVLMCVLIALLIILGMENIRKYKVAKELSILVGSAAFLIAIFWVWGNRGGFLPIEWSPFKWILFSCSLCACIGASLLLAHGYFMNMLLLRGETENKFIGVTANVLFVESLIFNLSVLVLILCQHTWKSLTLIGGLEVVLFVLIPVALANIQQIHWRTFKVEGNTPIGGVAQDGLMVTVLMLLGVGLPCMYVQMINTYSWSEWVTGVGLITSAFMPVGFCLKNNVRHMKRKKKQYEKYPEEEWMWEMMHKCLVRQSKQTVFAMLPYVCIAIGGCIAHRCLKSMEIKKILPDIYSTYIDGEKYLEIKEEKEHE